jgi:membrane protein implicated in regulation of membrane protease activity
MDGELVGAIGTLTVATRGANGVGEVLVRLRGGSETFLARSEEPLPRGTAVLVIEAHGARTVTVASLHETLQ